MLSDESMSTFSKEVPGFKDYVGGTTTCQTDGRPEVLKAKAGLYGKGQKNQTLEYFHEET